MAGTRDYIKPNSKVTAVANEYTDLDIMFTAHPISGDIISKKDSDAVKRAVRNVLLTNNYERPFKPNFGANLRQELFELKGPGAKRRFQSKIASSLMALEPRVSDVRIRFNSQPDSNDYNVTVFYTITKTRQSSAMDITVSRVR